MTASRPIIATMACIAILGLVKLYTNFVANMPRQQNQVITLEQATGDYALEITLTFRAESDAFDVIDPYAIKVTLDGVDDPVLMREDPVAAGVPIRVEPVKGLKVGENEFFVGIKIAENASNDGFDSADDDGFGTVSGDEDDGFATIDGFDTETPSDDDQAGVRSKEIRHHYEEETNEITEQVKMSMLFKRISVSKNKILIYNILCL